MIYRTTQKFSFLSVAALLLVSASAQTASASSAKSCETSEASRTYMSGLCPSDHKNMSGDQLIQLSYRCELMANDDFIVSETTKTTVCEAEEASKGISTAQAAPTPDSLTN